MRKLGMAGRATWLLAVLVALSPVCAAPPAADEVETVEEQEEQVPQKVQHMAIGSKVEVSSTHTGEPGEGPASALVDGDLTTRWSSDYSEPQKVQIDLGQVTRLGRMRLHWERASATKYSVMVSSDGKEWANVHLLYMKTRGEPEPRIDRVNLKGVSARYVRLDLLGCVNKEWGFSLYEVEITDNKGKAEAGKTGSDGK